MIRADCFILENVIMADRIIPLQCPSCGASDNDGLKERSFGGEMRCKRCAVVSVLIIENQWHQKKSGEYVCRQCGRIPREADRYCECSAALTRQCLMCRTEFFVGRSVCSNCGWNHQQDPKSAELQNDSAKRIWKLIQAGNMAETKAEFEKLAIFIKCSETLTPSSAAVIKKRCSRYPARRSMPPSRAPPAAPVA